MLSTIKHQDTGDLLKVAQYLTGYAARKTADGIFSADFAAAVCVWQLANSLSPDGVIGSVTWEKIVEKAPTCSTSKHKTSAATCALQILLNAGLDVDGVFGTNTKKAVAAYQAAKGLQVDGVCGRKTWSALVTGMAEEAPATPVSPTSATSPGPFKKPVDYKQYDSRWGSIVYTSCGNKSQTIKNSGCGPTAMADIVATVKDSSITPKDLAALSVKWGCRTKSSGTAWSFFRKIMEHFSFSKMVQTSSLATLKACLDAGGYVVCSMGPGYWTKGGHFITAWKYDDKYIYCNDPASGSRKRQNQTDFMKQRKQFFCFLK